MFSIPSIFHLKLERDASKLLTNKIFLVIAGGLYDGTRRTAIISALRTFCMVVGIFQFLMKMVTMDEEDSLLVLIETLHWMILLSSLLTMLVNYQLHSDLFLRMETTIKSGFFRYLEGLTEQQIKARAKANRDVMIITLVISACCAAALFSYILKAPLFMEERWSLSCPIWMPFRINTWFRYSVAMAWSSLLIETVATNGCMNWVMYMTTAMQLIGQFRVLILAVKDIDRLAKKRGSSERILASRIKQCVQHHLLLIKFFVDFQTEYNIILLVAAFSLGLMMCTLGFIIISPENSLAMKAPLLLLLVPEVFFAGSYCLLGQWIADVAEEVGLTVYKTQWYLMPLPIQKDLLMVMVGCNKPKQLTAMGLQQFSRMGLTEIIKTTFTYFNMLVVLSRK